MTQDRKEQDGLELIRCDPTGHSRVVLQAAMLKLWLTVLSVKLFEIQQTNFAIQFDETVTYGSVALQMEYGRLSGSLFSVSDFLRQHLRFFLNAMVCIQAFKKIALFGVFGGFLSNLTNLTKMKTA